MYCSKCGNELEKEKEYCGQCGIKVKIEEVKETGRNDVKQVKRKMIILTIIIFTTVGIVIVFMWRKSNQENNRLAQNENIAIATMKEDDFVQVIEEIEEISQEDEPTRLTENEIEEEILKIRSTWDADKEAIENNRYKATKIRDGITVYSDNGNIKLIEISRNIDDISYSRTYNFCNQRLTFVYIESEESSRLYFNEDKLFRWRYTVDVNDQDNVVNHDNERDLQGFIEWEGFALEEGYRIYREALDKIE